MPTSAPGSSVAFARPAGRGTVRGFTLVELLVVLVLVALSAAVVTLSLRDRDASQLEEEAARLSALLESARAESRVAGVAVLWAPVAAEVGGSPEAAQFRFTGLSGARRWPTRWLDAQVRAEVPGGVLRLGPDAILPAQSVRLRLNERTLELASDGLGPFEVRAPATPS
jgi:general secretion pathway protein H